MFQSNKLLYFAAATTKSESEQKWPKMHPFGGDPLPHLPPVGTACQQMAAMPPSWSLLFHTWSLLLQMLTKTLQTSGFRSAKEILVVSFATQPRAFILSDRNIFYTPRGGGGEQRRGLMPLGLFLFVIIFHFFFWWSLAPDLQFWLGQTNIRRKLSLYDLDWYLVTIIYFAP